jgi:histidine triad (HIT) family protein
MSPVTAEECLFCRIVAGAIPATLVAENDAAIAFRDLNPQAALHVLVVPRDHHADVVEVASTAPELLAAMVGLAGEVAEAEAGGQFRLVFNTGASAGQSVFHVHAHVIGGQPLGWSPA